MDGAAAGPATNPSLVIVTGAGGFVGRRLVERLLETDGAVIGVGRSAQPADWPRAARWLRADLADPSLYESTLRDADCVIHLAAVTGKATREAFFRGNVEATEALLAACRRAGVKRFVFVSSIAAAFADRRHYAYADSKIAAEAAVRAAPMTSIIVRPTMILGPGSPIEASLSRLARLPVAPIFGDGGRMVEPVDVEDVADLLAALARAPGIASATIELGGPERFDLKTLYARLRSAQGVAGAPRFLHLPLGPARWALALAERPLLPLLPLTAGQLATFANDSVAAASDVLQRLLPQRRASPRPGAGADRAALTAEGRRMLAYVLGVRPDDYQVAKYVDVHTHRPLRPQNPFDAVLVGLARSSWIGLALADSYSGFWFRTSAVRGKLIAALAIGEASGSSAETIATPDRGGRLALAAMTVRGALFVLSLLTAMLVLGPLHVLLARARAAEHRP